MTGRFQLDTVYSVVSDIIDMLDGEALLELSGGNDSDVDNIVDVMIDVADKAMFSIEDVSVNQSTFDYLDSVFKQFDEGLRIMSLNYFSLSVLSEFELAPHIMEWGNMVQLYRRLCIIAARGHSKSFTMSFANLIWRMYRYRETFMSKRNVELSLGKDMMLITNEFGLARKLLSFIREEIESNDILRERLYSGGDGWGKEMLKGKNGSQLYIKSYGSGMRGYHPRYIVVDDFLTENVLYSQEQKMKYNTFFSSVIENMLMKFGQIVVVGTPFVDGDLYDMLKKSDGWWVFEYPAIFPDGTILWETENNYESLMKIRDRIGAINFSREILVKPISDSSSVFSWDQFRRSFVGMEDIVIVDSIGLYKNKSIVSVAVGCDFALSESLAADYTVFTVVGVDAGGGVWLIGVLRGKGMRYSDQVSLAVSINDSFQPDVFVVETNGAQKIFSDMMTERGLPVLDHHTGVEKHSLTEGIPALAVMFDNGLVHIPYGDGRSKEIADRLGNQLTSFTYDSNKGKFVFVIDHDDDAMSLWQAVRGARYLHSGGTSFSFIDD